MLRDLTRRPSVLVTFQVIFVQTFSILVFAIQAPLIGPRAFGLVALVMIVIGFCESVVTAVTVDTLISVQDIDELHFATASTFAAAVAALIGLLMFVGSGLAADLMKDATLSPVLKWMAILPLLSALWAAPTAKTKREMQFKPTVIRSIVSLGLGGIVGMVLALSGAGVWALVCQALVYRSVGAVALWSAVPLRFHPAFSPSHFRELWGIALSLFAARIMSWATGQIPRFILGAYLGTVDLGLYSLGARFTDILVKLTIEPKTVIARISFRRFAGERSDLDESAHRLFMRTSAFCFPLCVGGAAIAPILVDAWLGPRWQGGITCMRLLLLACLPYVTYYCTTAILLAMNRRGAEAVISAVQVLAIIVFVSVSAPFGLNIAAAAIAASLFAVLPLPLIFLKRKCGIALSATLGAQIPACLASILMGVVVVMAGQRLEIALPAAEVVLILLVLGGVTYIAAISVLAPKLVRDQIRNLLALLSKVEGSPTKESSL